MIAVIYLMRIDIIIPAYLAGQRIILNTRRIITNKDLTQIVIYSRIISGSKTGLLLLFPPQLITWTPQPI